MIRFLDTEGVREIHALQIRRFGGAKGIRDEGLLESAVAQVQASSGGEYLHKDVYEMAAAYLFHLVQSHPCVDGNKRVGLHAALLFLRANGNRKHPRPKDLYELTMSVASGKMTRAKLIAEIRRLFG